MPTLVEKGGVGGVVGMDSTRPLTGRLRSDGGGGIGQTIKMQNGNEGHERLGVFLVLFP